MNNPDTFFKDSSNIKLNEILYKMRFTKEKVWDSLKKREINAKAEPEGVPVILLNKLADQLAGSLAKIYTQFMESGEFLWET